MAVAKTRAARLGEIRRLRSEWEYLSEASGVERGESWYAFVNGIWRARDLPLADVAAAARMTPRVTQITIAWVDFGVRQWRYA